MNRKVEVIKVTENGFNPASDLTVKAEEQVDVVFADNVRPSWMDKDAKLTFVNNTDKDYTHKA